MWPESLRSFAAVGEEGGNVPRPSDSSGISVLHGIALTHFHRLGNIKEEVLAELSHIPLAILAVMAGWSRWLELRLPAENHTPAWLTRLWPVCISLIGILLLNYREM